VKNNIAEPPEKIVTVDTKVKEEVNPQAPSNDELKVKDSVKIENTVIDDKKSTKETEVPAVVD
jgi:hypothetical protein